MLQGSGPLHNQAHCRSVAFQMNKPPLEQPIVSCVLRN